MTSGIKRADPFQDHEFVGGPVAKRAVPPVTAAVTADVLTLTAGALGGTCRRTAPLVQIKFTRSLFKTENRCSRRVASASDQ